ncbi:MAG: hypothetical protein AAF654_08480, partial [Myxococcota bacterium]
DVQPAPVAAADDVKPAPVAAADDVQPAPVAAADDVQPAPAAVADDVQPAPAAAADDVQPAPAAAADDVQPAPAAAADDVQPAPPAAPVRPAPVVDDAVAAGTARPGATALDDFPAELRPLVEAARMVTGGLNQDRGGLFRRLSARRTGRPDAVAELRTLDAYRAQFARDLDLAPAAGQLDDAYRLELRAAIEAIDGRVAQVSRGLPESLTRELARATRWNRANPSGVRRLWRGRRAQIDNRDLANFGRAFDLTDLVERVAAVRPTLAASADDVAIRELDEAVEQALQRLGDEIPNLVRIAQQEGARGHQVNLYLIRDSLRQVTGEAAEQARALVRQIDEAMPQDVVPRQINEVLPGGVDAVDEPVRRALAAAQPQPGMPFNVSGLRQDLGELVEAGGPSAGQARQLLEQIEGLPASISANPLDDIGRVIRESVQSSSARLDRLTRLMQEARSGTASADEALDSLYNLLRSIDDSRSSRGPILRVYRDDRANLQRLFHRFYRELREAESVLGPSVRTMDEARFLEMADIVRRQRGLGNELIGPINERLSRMRAALEPGAPVPPELTPILRSRIPGGRAARIAGTAWAVDSGLFLMVDVPENAPYIGNGRNWVVDATDDTLLEPVTDVFPGHFHIAENFITGWLAHSAYEAISDGFGF